jgi:hypothetical protein
MLRLAPPIFKLASFFKYGSSSTFTGELGSEGELITNSGDDGLLEFLGLGGDFYLLPTGLLLCYAAFYPLTGDLDLIAFPVTCSSIFLMLELEEDRMEF